MISVGPSCAFFKGKGVPSHRQTKPAALNAGPQRVGTITLVNEAARFVLIDTGMGAVPAIGTALKSFSGDAPSGVVAVGDVTRRPFVVADIVQGAPKKGDGVFQ